MEHPERKNLRLKDYDYSQNGAYFITICAYNHACIFGEIDVGQGLCSCRLSKQGGIINGEIINLEKRYRAIHIDKFVIMPNHVHIILSIVKERQEQSPCPTIGDVICTLKSITTKKINGFENVSGRRIWQFRFYDHIIRNEADYQKIWNYIDTNPLRWELDCYHNQREE